MLTVKYGPTRRPINPCIPIYKKGPVWGFVDLCISINSAINKEKKLQFIVFGPWPVLVGLICPWVPDLEYFQKYSPSE